MLSEHIARTNFPTHVYMITLDFITQSEVEETLERIKIQPGVEGYVICDMEGQVPTTCVYTRSIIGQSKASRACELPAVFAVNTVRHRARKYY